MRHIYKLLETWKHLNDVFVYYPKTGRIKYSENHDRAGQDAVTMYSGKAAVRYNNYICRASDLAAFLRYKIWFAYDAIDGDESNIRWSNLKRVKHDSATKITRDLSTEHKEKISASIRQNYLEKRLARDRRFKAAKSISE